MPCLHHHRTRTSDNGPWPPARSSSYADGRGLNSNSRAIAPHTCRTMGGSARWRAPWRVWFHTGVCVYTQEAGSFPHHGAPASQAAKLVMGDGELDHTRH